MAAYLPDEGEYYILNAILNGSGNCILGLFTNSSVSDTTTYAGITQPSGSGYATKTLTAGSWSITGTATTATYAAQTFTATGTWTGNVYGYFIASASGKLLAIETFTGGPYSFVNLDSISITPNITLA